MTKAILTTNLHAVLCWLFQYLNLNHKRSAIIEQFQTQIGIVPVSLAFASLFFLRCVIWGCLGASFFSIRFLVIFVNCFTNIELKLMMGLTWILLFLSCLGNQNQPENQLNESCFVDIVNKIGCHQSVYDDIDDITDKEQLRILRNAVYAANGYKFRSVELKNYFSQFPWYEPQVSQIDSFPYESNDLSNFEDIVWREFDLEVKAFVDRGSSKEIIDEELVGQWRFVPFAASAAGTNYYLFYDNGAVVYRLRPSSCTDREILELGTWTSSNGDLKITCTHEGIRTGGRLVKPKGWDQISCDSDKVLVNDVPRIRKTNYREFVIEKFNIAYDSINEIPVLKGASGERLWKNGNDPNY